MAKNDEQLKSIITGMAGQMRQMKAEHAALKNDWKALMRSIEEQPKSITEEIDSIPGRRIFYNLSDRQSFDTAQQGRRGDPLNFLVSQDGPFIQTHYPLIIWKPSAPDNASNFGFWRPVYHWPLPDQVLDTDIIDISYEQVDGGSQRNFQNEPSSGGPMSRPDNLMPLPVPTLFAPNSVIQIFVTFERILFDTGAAVPTEEGELAVCLPGYRVTNL